MYWLLVQTWSHRCSSHWKSWSGLWTYVSSITLVVTNRRTGSTRYVTITRFQEILSDLNYSPSTSFPILRTLSTSSEASLRLTSSQSLMKRRSRRDPAWTGIFTTLCTLSSLHYCRSSDKRLVHSCLKSGIILNCSVISSTNSWISTMEFETHGTICLIHTRAITGRD